MENKTRVRYAVHYNDRNYEYALHSGKGHFLRNLADVLNVLEYCVVQDLKKDNYQSLDKLYNYDVIRLVNDAEDEAWTNKDKPKFIEAVKTFVWQMIEDNIQRNA